MINIIFKSLFWIVAVCLTLMLYGIYTKTGIRTFQKSPSSPSIFDTKTGRLCIMNDDGLYLLNYKLEEVKVKGLPKD